MLRCTVLSSGSKGNCTVVSTSRTRLLLDAGLSCREITKRMRLAGEDPEKIDGLLITHEHQDHIQGVSVLARRWRVPVYFTEGTHRAWMRWMTPRKTMSFTAWLETRKQQAEEQALAAEDLAAKREVPELDLTEASLEPLEGAGSEAVESDWNLNLSAIAEDLKQAPAEVAGSNPAYLPAVEYFRAGVPFVVGDITITPFTVPHDATDPVGFVLEAEGLRIAIATDLGYMPPNVRMHLQRADLLVLESNHDVEMLRDGPYPWAVKQRVLSRVGHLSNDAASEFLADQYDGRAQWIVLAHLSESNNLPELARLSAERALQGRMGLLGNRVILASQSVPLESIYL
ncbi:MAG TPA: MBL fold metallo-hydrolase [Acidobacteriaceae bacterium]|jgi:phosphoribosyl 1,2-cyclic phosphodiesterase|nr:MBL fold metallo-hydrolase [Acidobacteriaceae bacterium]